MDWLKNWSSIFSDESPQDIEELLVADWKTVIQCSKKSDHINSLCDNKFWQMRRDLLAVDQTNPVNNSQDNQFQAYLQDLLVSLKNDLHQAHVSEVRRIESEIQEVKEALVVYAC